MKTVNGEHEDATEIHVLHQRVAQLEQENEALKQQLNNATSRDPEHESLLQLVVKYNPNAIAVYDRNLHYMAVSDRYMHDYTLAGQDVIGRHHLSVFPEMPQRWRDVHERCMAGAVEGSDEDFFVRLDGSVEYNRWECRPWYDATGAIGGIITFTEVITEHKQIENELCKTQEQYQSLIETVCDWIWEIDANGIYTYTSPQVRDLLGYEPEEILGRTPFDLMPPEEAQRVGAIFDGIVAERRRFRELETICYHKDGRYITLEASGVPFFAADGTLRGYRGVDRDITERKQAEAEVCENQERLQFILEGSSDGSWDWYITSGEAVFSDRYCEILGYASGELTGVVDSWVNLIHPDDAPAVSQALEVYLQGQRTAYDIEHRLRQKSGGWRWVLTRGKVVARDDQGNPVRMTGTITDIHERKQQEEQVQIFKALADHAPDAIGIANPDGTMIYANTTFRDLFGYGDNTLGMHHLDFFTQQEQQERLPAILEKIMAGAWTGLLTGQCSDGTTFPAQASGFVIRDEKGMLRALPTILRDMSRQKQREEELQRLVAVIENSTDFVGMAGPDGQVLYVNRAARQLVGLEPERDITQIYIPEFFMSEDLLYVQQQIFPTLMQQGSWRGEFRLRHFQTGEAIPIDYNLFLVKDQQTDELLSIATTIRDLTDQKQAEAERAALKDQVIEAQRVALRELSSPLIPISDHVVIMPLIGTIDTQRAQEIMETLLEGVARHHADIAIIDITGVRVVDTQVANALIQAAQAAGLLGSQVILTGIGPVMAQTLIHLGVDLSSMMTLSTLQHGVEYALERKAMHLNNNSLHRSSAQREHYSLH